MGEFVARQPNGLLCSFSMVTDCITDFNMTEEDYIERCAEIARKEAKETIEKHLVPFENVKTYFRPINMSVPEHHKILKMMKEPKENCVWNEVDWSDD